MRLLLDQGLPRSALVYLRQCQIETSHVAELGMSRASDSQILERARQENAVVVTLDADFHALLALSGDALPSVIRIRSEGLRGEDVAKLLTRLLSRIVSQLQEGAVVTLNERGARPFTDYPSSLGKSVSITTTIKSIPDIMRKDAGVDVYPPAPACSLPRRLTRGARTFFCLPEAATTTPCSLCMGDRFRSDCGCSLRSRRSPRRNLGRRSRRLIRAAEKPLAAVLRLPQTSAVRQGTDAGSSFHHVTADQAR